MGTTNAERWSGRPRMVCGNGEGREGAARHRIADSTSSEHAPLSQARHASRAIGPLRPRSQAARTGGFGRMRTSRS
eukprot:1840145-Prymnesium_polylepis.2